jgi:hypothetical protein
LLYTGAHIPDYGVVVGVAVVDFDPSIRLTPPPEASETVTCELMLGAWSIALPEKDFEPSGL